MAKNNEAKNNELKIDRVNFEVPYFQSPNTLFDLNLDLKANTKLVYLYLCRCGNQGADAFPSYDTIACACSIGRRTAIDCVKELVEVNLLYKQKRKNESGDATSNLYIVNLPEKSDCKRLTIEDIKAKKKTRKKGSATDAPPKNEKLSGATDAPPSATDALPSATDAPYKELLIKNQITNNYNTSSSSKGNATDSIHPLVELFNDSICELKKTTTAKFLNYVSKYDADFIASVIEYCEQQGAKSFTYFEKAIENYISKGLVTTSDMKASIENFRNENKVKKNSAIKEKEEAKNAEAFEQAMETASIDEMASIGEEIAVSVEAGVAESIDHIKESIKENISDIQFNTWFASTDFMKNNDVVYVSCCNGFSADIISKRYSVVLISALQENNIGYNKIEYIVKQ